MEIMDFYVVVLRVSVSKVIPAHTDLGLEFHVTGVRLDGKE